MPRGWNQRMQRRLRQHLRRRDVLEAEGSLQRWHEPMLLVAGDPRPIGRLAAQFRQRAIVVVRRRNRAQLYSCATMNSRWNGSSVVPSARRG
jgi:Protein of unknown function (DUF3293)